MATPVVKPAARPRARTDTRTPGSYLPGYTTAGRIDEEWWDAQLKLGEDWRAISAFEADWPVWRQYYKGDFNSMHRMLRTEGATSSQIAEAVLPVNIFFSFIRSQVPRTFFRNPTVSIIPSKPGADNIVRALVLQRLTNQLVRLIGLKPEMKRSTESTFLFGTGLIKTGMDVEANAGSNASAASAASKPAGYNPLWGVQREGFPWVKSLHPSDYVVPWGTTQFGATRWSAVRVIRPLEEFFLDPTLNARARSMPPYAPGGASAEFQATGDYGRVYEVRDWRTGKVFVFCREATVGARVVRDPVAAKKRNPVTAFVFNPADDTCWGIPDPVNIEPFQLDINETNTLLVYNKRQTIQKLIATKGTLDEDAKSNLISWPPGELIEVAGNPANVIMPMKAGTVPPELFTAMERELGLFRQTVAFSRMDMGEALKNNNSDTTATEVERVAQASDIRTDERRDILADGLVDVVSQLHAMLVENWPKGIVTDIVGPAGGMVWAHMTTEELRDFAYTVAIDPDSSVPETGDARFARARELFKMLAGDLAKDELGRPIINQAALRRHFLRETPGVLLDELMMDGSLLMAGQPAQDPMGVQDITKLLEARGLTPGEPVARGEPPSPEGVDGSPRPEMPAVPGGAARPASPAGAAPATPPTPGA